MNKVIYYLFLLLFVGMLWASCKKDSVAPATSSNTTPKDTPTLYVDLGKLYYFKPGATYKHNILNISGEYISGPISTDPSTWYVGLTFYTKSTGTYVLSTKNYASFTSGWYYEGTRGAWQTDSVHTGFVNLTTFDTINHIATGIFKFLGNQVGPIIGQDTATFSGTFTNITW